MRTIKFRAWDEFNGKMYYPDGNGYFFDEFSHDDFVIDGNGEPIFLSDMSTPKGVILEQFTGLKDKNGKEIYEGDIVKVHLFTQELGENLGVMEGEKEYECTITLSVSGVMLNDEPIAFYFDETWSDMSEPFEVIGNIHDGGQDGN